MPSSFKKVPWGLLFLVVILLDQASKRRELFLNIKNIGFIKLQASHNFLLAFSLNGSNAVGVALAVAWLLLAIVCLSRLNSRLGRVGMTLMIAGGASNLIDRLLRGGVRDIFMLGNSFFNLADIAILAGAAMLLFGLFYSKQPIESASG